MNRVIGWFEDSPMWLLGRFIFPAGARRRACVERGEHRLDLINCGTTKACGYCGTGLV